MREARIPGTIYLMCGLAFSGKTTLAAAIAGLVGAAIVSLDAINSERGLEGGAGIPEAEWARSHRQALETTESELAGGRSVVVDDTNCYRFLRDDYRAVAKRQGARTVVVYVDVPLSVVMARIRADADARTRPPIREAVLLDLVEKFEPPGSDEPTIVYTPDIAPASWVRTNLRPDDTRRVG
jgi:predicted kinase